MVVVAQLVRAPDCGSGGRRFETDLPPLFERDDIESSLFLFLYFKSAQQTRIERSIKIS